MNKILKMIAVFAFLIPLIGGCSGNKNNDGGKLASVENSASADGQDVVELKLDVDGINSLTKSEDLDAEDFDFILDQAEIIARRAKGMDRKEYNKMVESMEKEEKDALFILAMGLEAAKTSNKMSAAQKSRLEKIDSELPK